MRSLCLMSQSGAARAKARHEKDPDSVIMPIQLPKRLPYLPSIPVAQLRAIVKRVVERQDAAERQATLNASSN